MCELFGLSARLPTVVNFSLEEFARHGGITGPHADGWGIAFYDGMDAHIIREANAASTNPHLAFLEHHQFGSTTVVSHIRRASQARGSYRTHIPSRES